MGTTSLRWQQAAEAGWALKRSARQQKVLALTLGVSQSQLSRQISGLRSSSAAAFYADVRKTVAERKTEAGHLIAGALAAAEDEACSLSRDEIRARYYEAQCLEARAQAAEDVAQHRVLMALGRTEGPDASPDDLHELHEALEAHEEAVMDETAWHVVLVYYSRALRVSYGWRVRPEAGR